MIARRRSARNPLQEAPEILDTVRVDLPAHVLNRVVDYLVLVVPREAAIARPCVCVEACARLDRAAHLFVQRGLLDVRTAPAAHGYAARTSAANRATRLWNTSAWPAISAAAFVSDSAAPLVCRASASMPSSAVRTSAAPAAARST